MKPASLSIQTRADGATFVRNATPLPDHSSRMTDRLEVWAREAPQRDFLLEPAGDDWRRAGYAETLAAAKAIAASLVARGLSAERPIAILSENSIDHALLSLGAQYAGIPVAPISPAYALGSTFEKLRSVVEALAPGLVYVSDGTRFANGLAATIPLDVEVVASTNLPVTRPATPFESLLTGEPGEELARAHDAVGPSTVAKILFTSGTTGSPKGVINDHRMLSSNQAMVRHMYPFLAEEPPVLVDWLPWHHTFGGNHNFNLVLNNGGTMYINRGTPTPNGFAETIRVLRSVSPTAHFDVPRGYNMLVVALRADRELRERFFLRLRMLFYAAASLTRETWDALEELARASRGSNVLMTTSLGSTETAPMALAVPWPIDGPGMIGVPAPGIELKLMPAEGGKLELRLRGPNVTPGYWRSPEHTRAAFDEDGFYKTGDAVRFVDGADPNLGFIFDGRLAENFKLGSGTFVNVGAVRLRFLSQFTPLLADAVVSGEDREEIGMLAFPDLEACRAIATDAPAGADLDAVLRSPRLRAHLQALLDDLARGDRGSSTRVERLLLVREPPSLDAGESTDKGTLNQRAILRRRATLVDDLHRQPPGDDVIVLSALTAAAST